jgi:3-oxoacyl-[acyl-carrier protein] reductase
MKTVIVFGHTSGLGLDTTKILLNKNYKVVGFARSKSSLKAENLEDRSIDLSKKENVEKAVSIIQEKYPIFDCLIYSAGTLTSHAIDNLDYDEMEQLYKINVFAPIILESKLLPLIKKNEADVVNITSSALIEYYPLFAEYASSKAALQKFTKDLQKELKETKSRVIDFCPSGFTSNLYVRMAGDKVNRDESIQMQAKDVAKLLVFLLELPKKIEISNIFVNRK